jgi:chromosome segregation ATPase
MYGFVGSRAKKKQRNIFFTLIFSIFSIVVYFNFPKFEDTNNVIIPDDNIMPDPSEDLTSLTANIEELELSLFQKDQKIKFRDGQIANLQSELKNIQSQYELVILELNNNKNKSANDDLILSNKYKSLQDNFTKLNIQNEKNITIIKNQNKKIDDLNGNLLLNEDIENIISNNKKLKKDNKIFFGKNTKLESLIKGLEKKIIDQKNDINSKLEQIEKLKDKSHHGG